MSVQGHVMRVRVTIGARVMRFRFRFRFRVRVRVRVRLGLGLGLGFCVVRSEDMLTPTLAQVPHAHLVREI